MLRFPGQVIVLISTFLNSDLGARAGCEERGLSSEFPFTFLGGMGGRGSGAGFWQNVKEDKVWTWQLPLSISSCTLLIPSTVILPFTSSYSRPRPALLHKEPQTLPLMTSLNNQKLNPFRAAVWGLEGSKFSEVNESCLTLRYLFTFKHFITLYYPQNELPSYKITGRGLEWVKTWQWRQ